MVIVSNEWLISLEFEMVFPCGSSQSSRGLKGTLIPCLLHMMLRPYYTSREHDDLADATFPFYNRALGTLMILAVDGHPKAPSYAKTLSSSCLALRILDDVPNGLNVPPGWP